MGPVERDVHKLLRLLDDIERYAKQLSGDAWFPGSKIRGTADDMRRKIKAIERKVRTLETE